MRFPFHNNHQISIYPQVVSQIRPNYISLRTTMSSQPPLPSDEGIIIRPVCWKNVPVVPSVTLHAVDENNARRQDVKMPMLGIGTYKFAKGSGEAERAVANALQMGYRHVDTAFVYGRGNTEREVGNAIWKMTQNDDSYDDDNYDDSYDNDDDDAKEAMKKSLPPFLTRRDIFITTKQWRDYHGYEPTLECLEKHGVPWKMQYTNANAKP